MTCLRNDDMAGRPSAVITAIDTGWGVAASNTRLVAATQLCKRNGENGIVGANPDRRQAVGGL